MGAAHGRGHTLHFHGHSLLHRLPAWSKIVALVCFMLIVVATPRGVWPAYGAYLVLLLALIVISRVPFGFLLPRMVVEVPFLVFAATMPFVARGPRVDVLGWSLSQEGLDGAGALVAKGTLGVLAALLLGATTQVRDLLVGLQKLRLPQQLVEILAFMLRYLTVIVEDLRRMRIAQQARGFTARNIRQWPTLASTVGTLFVRSFERGERVHRAMLARGYRGALPLQAGTDSARWQWALVLPLTAAAVWTWTMVR